MYKPILLFLLLPVLLIGCKKEVESTAPFIELSAHELVLAATAGRGELVLRWAYSEWELESDEDGFLSDFTFKQGGSKAHASTTRIQFDYQENATGEERSQELVFRNRTTATEQVVKITQSHKPPMVLNVNGAIKHQYIDGIGGMNTQRLWIGAEYLATEAEIDKMFSPNGLGYTILHIMNSVNAREMHWEDDMLRALWAQKHGAIIFASSEVPSAMIERHSDNTRNYLNPAKYQEYADHIVRYIHYMQGHGVNLYAMSLMNEPDMSTCNWTPAEFVDFLKKHGDEIRATGVKVMGPETAGFHPNYSNAIFNDSEAFAKTDIIAGHYYQGFIDTASSTYVRDRHRYISEMYNQHLRASGKGWWMTEHLFNKGERNEQGDLETDPEKWEFRKWNYNLNTLGLELHMSMKADCSAYVWFYLKRFYSMVADPDPRSPVPEGEITNNGYILSHYAKYASRRTRIHVDTPREYPDLHVTAYEGDEDITLVIVNLSDQSVPPIQFDINNGNISTVSAEESTEMGEMVNKKIVLVNTSMVAVDFKPMSIVSIKLKK